MKTSSRLSVAAAEGDHAKPGEHQLAEHVGLGSPVAVVQELDHFALDPQVVHVARAASHCRRRRRPPSTRSCTVRCVCRAR